MADSKDKSTQVLKKSETLQFGDNSAFEQSSKATDKTPKKVVTENKTVEELLAASIAEQKKTNTKLEKLNKANQQNESAIIAVAEALNKSTKIQEEEREEKKTKDKKKKSSGSSDSNVLNNLNPMNAIAATTGLQPVAQTADDIAVSAASAISPVLGITVKGIESLGLNTKGIGKALKTTTDEIGSRTAKFVKKLAENTDEVEQDTEIKKSAKSSSGRPRVKASESSSKVTAKAGTTRKSTRSLDTDTTTSSRRKSTVSVDSPIPTPKKAKSSSAKTALENEEIAERKKATALQQQNHNKVIGGLEKINKTIEEKEFNGGGLDWILGAGGLALLAGLLTSDKVRSFFGNAIKDWITEPFDSIKGAVGNFTTKVMGKMIGSASRMVNNTVSAATRAVSTIGKAVTNVGSKLGNITKSIASKMGNVVKGISSKLGSMMSKISSKATSLLGSITKGLSSKVGSIFSSLKSGAGKLLSTIGKSKIGSIVGKGIKGAGKLLKGGGKALGLAGKAVKGVAKKIPFLGLAIGGVSAVKRAMAGDWTGAALELGSGIASTIPGVGTAVSLALDGVSLTRDIIKANDKENESAIRPTEAYLKEAGTYGTTQELTDEEIKNAVKSEDASSLGVLSNRYEGRTGTVSSGRGDAGGVSFGKYQFSSKTGGVYEFMNKIKETHPDVYNRLMMNGAEYYANKDANQAFQANWRAVAEQDPELFSRIQDEVAKEKWYDPKAREFEKMTGVDLSKNKALANAVWSAAIQHGDPSNKIYSMSGITADMSEEEQLRRFYEARREYVSGLNIQNKGSLYNRYTHELDDAIKMSRTARAGEGATDLGEFNQPLNMRQKAALGYSAGTLDTNSDLKTADAIVMKNQQNELISAMNKNTETKVQGGDGSGTNVSINTSNFVPVNSTAYLALHQGA